MSQAVDQVVAAPAWHDVLGLPPSASLEAAEYQATLFLRLLTADGPYRSAGLALLVEAAIGQRRSLARGIRRRHSARPWLMRMRLRVVGAPVR